MQSENLIQSLIEQTQAVINQVEKVRNCDSQQLTWREHPTSWNILECLEHLNLYSDFYLPQIEKSIKISKTKSEFEFKSGRLGNFFATSMLPKDELNKMKTFKNKNPLHTALDATVIEKFLAQQKQLLELLNQSRNISLNKVKIATSLTSLLKLKLGDTFRFVINHNIRHLKQIENILSAKQRHI